MRVRQQRTLWRLLALLAAFAMLAAACAGDDGEDTAAESEEAEAEDEEASDEASSDADGAEDEEEAMEDDEATEAVTDLTVAIVAPSASDDLAFTQSMIDALDALGIEPDVTDGTFVVEEAAEAIRGYADTGFDVVIAHGTQFGGSLAEIAPDFPETSFIWGTSADNQGIDNVFAYTPAANEGAYVLGTIAAQLSESGQIGMVGPIEAGDASLYVEGFVLGAEAEGASVNVTYTGSFGDVALATEAAQAHLDVGSDVLTGTAQHVVGAIQIASANDVPWFATQANQTSLAPDLVVASQVYHWEVVLEEMFEMIEGGTLGGEAFELNLANGGLVIEYNDGFELSDEIVEGADATVAGIIDGSIATLG